MSDTEHKREIKGFWWSPDVPEKRWFGTLKLATGHSPHLELLIERPPVFDDIGALGRIIHGTDEHGQDISLLHLGVSRDSISGAVVQRKVKAAYALLGIKLHKTEDFVANSLRFSVQQLYGWSGRSGFDTRERWTPNNFSIRYVNPEDLWFSVSPDLDVGIHSIYQANQSFQGRQINEDAALTFRCKSGMSLARCQQLVGAVRLLLHLACLKQVYPVWLTVYQDGLRKQIADQSMPIGIELHNSILREPDGGSAFADDWVFRFNDVCPDFAKFVAAWLNFCEKYHEPLGCYSSTIYHSLTPELTLLSLTLALEAYHGIKFQSHKDRNFKKKIETLVQNQASSLQGVINNVSTFTEVVHVTRNYYTHHNPRWQLTGKVASRSELIRLNEKLKLLFQMSVLTDLGIPSNRFVRLRSQLASQIIEFP